MTIALPHDPQEGTPTTTPEAAEFAADTDGLTRRSALKAMAAAASLPVLGSLPILELDAAGAPLAPGAPNAAEPGPARLASGPRGTASDPDLLRAKANWPRKLLASEMATVAALCDMIMPADGRSPSASAVGVPAYINEHVSAPYEEQQRDLVRVRGGLAWLNLESTKRFGHVFAQCTTAQKAQICDEICFVPRAKPEFKGPARFFALMRNLCATAFYTTDEGMKDIGYVGNVALPAWGPPPAAVLKHLGLD